MRRILVDHARRRHAQRRSGAARRCQLDDVLLPVEPPPCDDLLALDEALSKLAAEDPVKARLVELRFSPA
jgi:hypothetical protein